MGDECEALVVFFNATGGAGWNDRRGRLESHQVCSWFGISCTGGHVTSISMNCIDLRGELPTEFISLEHLEMLSLYYNHLLAQNNFRLVCSG